ncbi:hypothetical protein IAQ61_006959, partial [Plenodomus lingam]
GTRIPTQLLDLELSQLSLAHCKGVEKTISLCVVFCTDVRLWQWWSMGDEAEVSKVNFLAKGRSTEASRGLVRPILQPPFRSSNHGFLHAVTYDP